VYATFGFLSDCAYAGLKHTELAAAAVIPKACRLVTDFINSLQMTLAAHDAADRFTSLNFRSTKGQLFVCPVTL
jgi:hypothetical protein